ncbi:MAG: hypothetical protein JWP22_5 [Ramlibacter sp.]|nr:hypothetical protein [Ramlibacter sp.]
MSELSLETLRQQGAQSLDPVRFRYLEALSQRIPTQPGPVQKLLQVKMQAALAEYAKRCAQMQPAGAARKQPQVVPTGPAALAQLNAYIRSSASARIETATPGEPPPADELASARRFRGAWQRSRTEQQVQQAVARKPAHAGPLNSHVLVLQSVAMLQELSPAYLRRFVAQVEALQWLERAAAAYPQPQAKQPPKRAKPMRTARLKK